MIIIDNWIFFNHSKIVSEIVNNNKHFDVFLQNQTKIKF